MPLFDKVKSQAAQLAQAAQEAGKAGQARLAEVQAKKHADEMLHNLGLAVLAARTGRANEDTAAEIEQLLASLTEHERAHGSLVDTGGPEDTDEEPQDAGSPAAASAPGAGSWAADAPVTGSGAAAGGPPGGGTQPTGFIPRAVSPESPGQGTEPAPGSPE